MPRTYPPTNRDPPWSRSHGRRRGLCLLRNHRYLNPSQGFGRRFISASSKTLDQQYLSGLVRAEARRVVANAATELLAQEQVRGIAEYRDRLVEEIVDEVLGLGPLEPLLRDDSVTEIMVNGPDRIYVERAGRLQHTRYAFRDAEHLSRIIERIVSPVGRHVDEASPMVDARPRRAAPS